jgi:O-antigen/teichoic acid export membrane protein
VAGALPMASAIILLPFYIYYLPTESYGALTLSLSIATLVQIITAYSFDSSLYIHYHELLSNKEKLNPFISSAFIFMLGSGLIIGVSLSIIGQWVFTLVLPGNSISFYPYGFVAVGVGIFQAIFKVHGNLLQTREKPEVFLWSNVFSFGVIAITTIVGLKMFPGTLMGPLGGRLLAAFGGATWVLVRIFREFGFHFTSPWKFTSKSFNAFTFVYQLQQWVINSIDMFIILFFMPTAALATVGVYSFAIKCLAPIELLLNGLNASMFPQIIKLINKQNQVKSSTVEINRYFYGQISVMMLMIVGSILVLPWIMNGFVSWFAQKSNYLAALEFVPYIAVLFIFRSMRLFFVVPYNVLKKMKQLTFLSFFISVVKIGLMAIFIMQWQVMGVIASAALAYTIELVLLWYFLKQDYQMKFNGFKLIVAPMFLLLVIVVTEPILGSKFPTIVHLGYAALCALLLWFSYRNELKLVNPFKMFK